MLRSPAVSWTRGELRSCPSFALGWVVYALCFPVAFCWGEQGWTCSEQTLQWDLKKFGPLNKYSLHTVLSRPTMPLVIHAPTRQGEWPEQADLQQVRQFEHGGTWKMFPLPQFGIISHVALNSTRPDWLLLRTLTTSVRRA